MASRVLIADDNEINREFLFGVLAGEDYQIEQAVDGRAAIELCRKRTFDVILMDIRMPEVDGVEATARIRELPGYQRTPIVALTADLAQRRERELLRSGFDATLAKPVARRTLLNTLARLSGEAVEEETIAADAPIDRQAALAAAGGNAELVDRLTSMLARELDQFRPAIAEAIERGEPERAREMAHKLRASAGYCGAKPVQRAAAALEEALKTGEDLDTALGELHERGDDLKAFLDRSA